MAVQLVIVDCDGTKIRDSKPNLKKRRHTLVNKSIESNVKPFRSQRTVAVLYFFFGG